MADSYDTAPLAARMTEFVPHAAGVGMTLVSVGDGRGVMRVEWREDLVGDPDTGVIASGVVTALIDHTCGLAINAVFDAPSPIATLDLRIDYLRPAAPRTGVTCEAFGYKTTRSIGFVRAEAWDVDKGDLIATAQAAFMLNPRS
ncbi:PaaI family thioesterase [uncultured Phenylobacterium sp.]|uniref:PaaI family thioesterase n=1 Tax=uncultured Phenylobacterium sp. TaxID=349273 RepID=UPI0025D04BAA|nr:PaaI family thioesterase [uncultured Phenylobacterium sp.]